MIIPLEGIETANKELKNILKSEEKAQNFFK